MADPTVAEAVALPPKEAIAFLRQKTNQTTQRWTDVWNEAHSRAFSVAGAATEALVKDFRDAVAKAIETGTTLKEFRADFDAIVAKHGWVHNGSAAWRAQLIYETNLSTAYSAGRYAQMTEPDNLEAFPYWRYQHNAAIHPRVQHLAWDGLVLKADDPWWSTHYPPNGWRCHCSVAPVSRGGLRRMGRTEPDKAPPIDMRTMNVRGRGAVQVPAGIDPGFAYNPGQAWLEHADRPVVGQLPARAPAAGGTPAAPRRPMPPAVHVDHPEPDAGPVQVERAVPQVVHPIPPPPTPPASMLEVNRFFRHPVGNLPVGVLHPDVAAAIGAKDRTVWLSAETMEKQHVRHPDVMAFNYYDVAEVVGAPTLAVADGTNRVVLFRRIGRLLYVVVKRTADGGETYAISVFKGNAKDVRRVVRRGRILLGSVEALLGKDGS